MSNLIPRLEFLVQALVRRNRVCPHCSSPNSRVIARKRATVRVRRCRDCLLCFTDPLYERSVFGPLYQRLYGAEGSTTDLPTPDALSRVRATAFRGTDKDFNPRIERLRRIAPGPKLLELGSSWGYFLFQAEAHGFDATGVEICEPRRAFGRRELGVSILGSLDEVSDRDFDLVYTSHTLEHFTDLRGVLPRLGSFLRPGGLLAIEVPHFDFDARGKAALSAVGAVHPLGFSSAFFARNLPLAGLHVRGFYDSWDDFPERHGKASHADIVLVLAERLRSSEVEVAA